MKKIMICLCFTAVSMLSTNAVTTNTGQQTFGQKIKSGFQKFGNTVKQIFVAGLKETASAQYTVQQLSASLVNIDNIVTNITSIAPSLEDSSKGISSAAITATASTLQQAISALSQAASQSTATSPLNTFIQTNPTAMSYFQNVITQINQLVANMQTMSQTLTQFPDKVGFVNLVDTYKNQLQSKVQELQTLFNASIGNIDLNSHISQQIQSGITSAATNAMQGVQNNIQQGINAANGVNNVLGAAQQGVAQAATSSAVQ